MNGDWSVEQLQEMQARFEQSCGLALASSASAAFTEGSWEDVEFAGMALAGEVGELMNILKRRRLDIWQGVPAERRAAEVEREIGDCLAYLLRLASATSTSASRIYGETLVVNYFRFSGRGRPSERTLVTIFGPPGSGKSTVCRGLSEQFPTYVENPRENPYLLSAWRTGESAALESQLWFLDRVLEFVNEHQSDDLIVVDQDPVVISCVYGRQLLSDGLLNQEQYMRLLRRAVELEEVVRDRGRLVIWLETTQEVLVERLASRDEWDEAQIERLEAITAAFEELKARREGILSIRTDVESNEVAQAASDAVREAASLAAKVGRPIQTSV